MPLSFQVRALLLLVVFVCLHFRILEVFLNEHPMDQLRRFINHSKRVQVALIFRGSLNLVFGVLWLWPLPWTVLEIYLLVSTLVAYALFSQRLADRMEGMDFWMQDRSGQLRGKVYQFVQAELEQRGYQIGPSTEGLVLKADRRAVNTPRFYWCGVLLICCGVLPGIIWYRCCGDRFKLVLFNDGFMLKTDLDIMGAQAVYDWHRIYFRMLEKNWLFRQAVSDTSAISK